MSRPAARRRARGSSGYSTDSAIDPAPQCPAARDDGGAPLGWHDRGRGGDLGAAENAGDVVVVTVPHTPETHGLFDVSKFNLMKSHALFINIVRTTYTLASSFHPAVRRVL